MSNSVFFHLQSRCVATGPGQANCTCPEGLGGDGLSCFGDLVYELTNHPQLTTLHELLSVRTIIHDCINKIINESISLF